MMKSETDYYESCSLCGDESPRATAEWAAKERLDEAGYVQFIDWLKFEHWLCKRCLTGIQNIGRAISVTVVPLTDAQRESLTINKPL
jgi:hypothetical protein